MDSADGPDDLLTITAAARLGTLSEKALRRRIERGTLESVRVGGQRLIPLRALREARLLDPGASAAQGGGPDMQRMAIELLMRQGRRLAELERRVADLEHERERAEHARFSPADGAP
ncbi:MAG TPA: hypothetical protein VHX88_00610 [Solirubrobacteraceae bacterium]|jgi:excisionase family DNA binding protein|nr:hypothetical protein [Solirubrobacteraceae bacterium]